MATHNDQSPTGQVLRLQDEITREVNGDAEHIATAVFGKPGDMPDMQRMSDEELDARYRQAYQGQDRQWLTKEAQRDPEQFVKVARRIGVVRPDEMPPPAPTPTPAPALTQPMPALPMPAPPAPVAAPAPVPPMTPAAVPPMIPAGLNPGVLAQAGPPMPMPPPGQVA